MKKFVVSLAKPCDCERLGIVVVMRVRFGIAAFDARLPDKPSGSRLGQNLGLSLALFGMPLPIFHVVTLLTVLRAVGFVGGILALTATVSPIANLSGSRRDRLAAMSAFVASFR